MVHEHENRVVHLPLRASRSSGVELSSDEVLASKHIGPWRERKGFKIRTFSHDLAPKV